MVQGVWPSSGPAPARLTELTTANESGTELTLLNGHLKVDLQEVPTLGSEDAPKFVAVLFDYSCPHCRATHEYLIAALDRYPNQLRIALLPMPLNTDCNPGEVETEERFKDSCELAQLALGVWLTQREKFAAFDEWLFEPETPRSAEEARQYATQLVSERALEEALEDGWIDEQIALDVRAYMDAKAERIPVITASGMDAIVGRPENAEALFTLLELELSLTPVE